jgi:hypothetical protein
MDLGFLTAFLSPIFVFLSTGWPNITLRVIAVACAFGAVSGVVASFSIPTLRRLGVQGNDREASSASRFLAIYMVIFAGLFWLCAISFAAYLPPTGVYIRLEGRIDSEVREVVEAMKWPQLARGRLLIRIAPENGFVVLEVPFDPKRFAEEVPTARADILEGFVMLSDSAFNIWRSDGSGRVLEHPSDYLVRIRDVLRPYSFRLGYPKIVLATVRSDGSKLAIETSLNEDASTPRCNAVLIKDKNRFEVGTSETFPFENGLEQVALDCNGADGVKAVAQFLDVDAGPGYR